MDFAAPRRAIVNRISPTCRKTRGVCNSNATYNLLVPVWNSPKKPVRTSDLQQGVECRCSCTGHVQKSRRLVLFSRTPPRQDTCSTTTK